uniref:Cyclin-dependent kinase inhibitor domain-containing protein n=1 Tax=Cuscuta australis TaxID=267555 RepID=A0A328DN81_9ASTE|nr:hypothetical protein DM860_004999 [Cuscuta australis]
MMGRNVEKPNGIGEVAGTEMPEIGVMTTASTPEAGTDVDAEPVVVKKRKISDEDLEPSLAPAPPQPGNSGGDPAIPEECASPERHPVSSLNVDEEAQASGCSSYEESIARGKSEIADLEEEESTGEFEAASSWNSECAESGKTTPLREHETESDELGSNGTPPQWPPGDQSNSHVNAIRANMRPSDAELEDFFSLAEQKIQQSFEHKYNFDVVNEKPLEGRYEWVQSVQPYNKEEEEEEEEEEDSSPSTAIPKKV